MDPRRLIFDVGANNGEDAEYYLKKGFQVVAIEPMPDLCDAIRDRLAGYLTTGQLAIEAVAIAAAAGERKLHVSRFSEWSSLMLNHKNKGDWDAGVLDVRSATIDDLIGKYGQPYYIKIDIEGMELRALSAYGYRGKLADYVSIEVNDDWLACCERLTRLGYRSFQLMRQGKGFPPAPPFPAREGEYVPQVFVNAMSGPFGRELPGPWLSLAALDVTVKEAARQRQERLARGELGGWHDIHASLNDPAES